MAAGRTVPAKLPTVKAIAMVARDHPMSSPMGLTNTPRTGPNMRAEAKEMSSVEAGMAQP